MSRSAQLSLSLILVCAVACSKSGSDAAAQTTAHTAASTSTSGSLFSTGGGGACAKYLTPDVVQKILGGAVRAPEVLSPNSCKLSRTNYAGSITITLFHSPAESFHDSWKNLQNPTPLAGVGDQAVQHLLGISAVKKPNLWCDIDAGAAPGSTPLSHDALGKALGDLCNRMFADGP